MNGYNNVSITPLIILLSNYSFILRPIEIRFQYICLSNIVGEISMCSMCLEFVRPYANVGHMPIIISVVTDYIILI